MHAPYHRNLCEKCCIDLADLFRKFLLAIAGLPWAIFAECDLAIIIQEIAMGYFFFPRKALMGTLIYVAI